MRNVDGPEPSDSPELAEYKRVVGESVNARFAEQTLVLRAEEVVEVHVIYGAGNDDGGIEEVRYFKRDSAGELSPQETAVLEALDKQIEELMYGIMDSRGFSNHNEGCQGVIRWMVDEDMLIHDHQYNEYNDDGETEYVPQPVETYWGLGGRR